MRMRWGVALPAALVLCASVAYSQDAAKSVWTGVYSADQEVRGKAAYAGKCAGCHGGEKEGGEMAPALVGSAFLANWDKQSVGALAERIHTTMPANMPGTLSQAATTDIVAELLSANGMPAGTQDLPRDAAAQRGIRIDALKPS